MMRLWSLPTHVLEAIVQRLSLRDVLGLWQTCRAMQTALRPCIWPNTLWLDGEDRDLMRMFAPGGVRRIGVGWALLSKRMGRRDWECLMAHMRHVESLTLVSADPTTALAVLKPRRPPWMPLLDSLRRLVISPKQDRATVVAANLAPLSHLTKLSSLVFYNGVLDSSVLDVVLRLPGLRKLGLLFVYLKDGRNVKDPADETTAKGLEALAAASSLEHLHLHSCSHVLRENLEAGLEHVRAHFPDCVSMYLDELKGTEPSYEIDMKCDEIDGICLRELEACLGHGPQIIYQDIPSWVAKLPAVQSIALVGGKIDLTMFAGLPTLRSLTAGVVWADLCFHEFPFLRVLHLKGGWDVSFNFNMFQSLEELRLDTDGSFKFMGKLASMSLLTSLELHMPPHRKGSANECRPLNFRPFSSLRNLRSVAMDLGVVRRPLDLCVLAHVCSVDLRGEMEEAEVYGVEQLASVETLSCECSNPLALASHLSNLSCLTSLKVSGPSHHTTPQPRSSSDVQQRQPAAEHVVLQQLRSLELRHLNSMDEAWGWMLPNVVRLVLSDGGMTCLPDAPKGTWPSLKFLEILRGRSLASISHTWFTLPSLCRVVLSHCNDLTHLPDIPTASDTEHAPLREVELLSCRSLCRVPTTFANLRKLTCIKVHDCAMLELPKHLDGSRIAVVRGDATRG